LTWVICVDEDRIVEMRAYFDSGLVEDSKTFSIGVIYLTYGPAEKNAEG